MRPKFRAYIKDIDLMLYDVDVYAKHGHIGIHVDDLEKQFPVELSLMGDEIYFHEGEEPHLKMSVLTGDEYIWFEENQYELMQWSPLYQAYDKDYIKQNDLIYHLSFDEYGLPTVYPDHHILQVDEPMEIIGNSHQHKHLIK